MFAHPNFQDFLLVKSSIYTPQGLFVNNLVEDKEGKEYGAHTFVLNNKIIKLRFAKITLLKIGQFVTFYKRSISKSIIPYDITDDFDFLVIHTRLNDRLGQFIFPKEILLKKGVISEYGIGGKRAIRVYSPWDLVKNKQAKKTQEWQNDYFFEVIITQETGNVISAHFKSLSTLGKQLLTSLGIK